MTVKELREKQKWTLEQKIDHSLGTIEKFYNECKGNVYISFSGGKDSTIVLWLAKKLYPNIKAVFCNTGNEFPDIVRFVREEKDVRGSNIEIIYPKMKPFEVLSKYGFPLVSKSVSSIIRKSKDNPNGLTYQNYVVSKKSLFSLGEKWEYLISEKYRCSERCCDILKKAPAHEYMKNTNLQPILGTMASESMLREKVYLKQGGCNFFDGKGGGKSMPLSIWTEQDVWNCIEQYKIPIADIYHKGAKRTGCMFCGFGAAFKDDYRFNLLYKLYPKWYDKFMKYENNGVTYREALRKMMMVNDKYLPDEEPLSLFSDKDFD